MRDWVGMVRLAVFSVRVFCLGNAGAKGVGSRGRVGFGNSGVDDDVKKVEMCLKSMHDTEIQRPRMSIWTRFSEMARSGIA